MLFHIYMERTCCKNKTNSTQCVKIFFFRIIYVNSVWFVRFTIETAKE